MDLKRQRLCSVHASAADTPYNLLWVRHTEKIGLCTYGTLQIKKSKTADGHDPGSRYDDEFHPFPAALLHFHGDIVSFPHWYQRVWDYVTTDPHLSMLSLFVLWALVDILEPKRSLGIKKYTSHFIITMAYFTLTLAILFHGFAPKCAYSGRVYYDYYLN